MTYSPEQIREAMKQCGGPDNNYIDIYIDRVIDALENPVEFAEGQIVVEYPDKDRPGHQAVYWKDHLPCLGNRFRNQNMQELGPHVGKLVEAMEQISNGLIGQGGYEPISCPVAVEALEAFRRAHG